MFGEISYQTSEMAFARQKSNKMLHSVIATYNLRTKYRFKEESKFFRHVYKLCIIPKLTVQSIDTIHMLV